MQLPKLILVPTDFSETADRALDHAISLAKNFGAKIVVLHAYELPVLALPEGGLVFTTEVALSMRKSALAAMEKVTTARKSLGVELQSLIKDGDPRFVIVEAAKEVAADMIILGTHGRRGVSRLLLGSVAESVVRSAACPVLTIRERHG